MILDIIIPIYNKEKEVLNYYNKINEELKNIKHKFIFVDNYSSDKSLDVIENIYKNDEENVKIISMSKRNKDMAIYAGLYFSKHDFVCIYDTDLNVNSSYLTKMYEKLTKNIHLDEVSLYIKNPNISKCLNIKRRITNFILKTNYDYNKTYFRMFRKEVVPAIIALSQNYRFSVYSFDMIGFNQEYIDYNTDTDQIDIISFKKLYNYSDNPLLIVKYFSYILIFISIVLLVLNLFTFFKVNNEMILLFLFLFNTINLFLLSIICNCKNKNNKTDFFIRRKIGFDENFL